MANTRPELRYGATGDYVKELQTRLKDAGVYNASVDGIWGDKTDAAVKAYQKSVGLGVDGIVGEKTWGELLKSAKPSTPNSYSNIDLSQYSNGYQKSADVISAEQKKADAEKAVADYGDFSYSKQTDYDDIINKIMNREKFSYDLNGDALYQQYKDKYIQQGKMAMQDTMGQAAAMTGGYGNSYASTVGNQAYQAQLNNLNDVIPELYQMAYDKYNQEGQDLYNQYGMLSDDRSTEYGMWGDKRNQLLTDRGYYSDEANNAYNKDYGQWSDNRTYDQNQYWKETEFGYGQYRDEVADWENERAFQEGVRQFNETMAFNKEKAAQAGSNDDGGDDEPKTPTKNDYSDWSGGDWESYFAQIRQSEGQAAAEQELKEFTEKGYIPQNMVALAASGARGGKLGH